MAGMIEQFAMTDRKPEFAFRILSRDRQARIGVMTTPHGEVLTPAFMPVGTAATVKAAFPDMVKRTGADMILANTYHLMLRPGAERINRLGGLHRFMNWSYPLLTDSGGFQIMSLAQLHTISEQGTNFRSHLDGSYHSLTPEKAIEIQCLLGSDIQMQLDECLRLPMGFNELNRAMNLSLRWAERSGKAFERSSSPGQALFGIVQGGDNLDLRRESLRHLVAMNLSGYAIGGLAVGESQSKMLAIIDHLIQLGMPDEKPRYLMGVGTPDDLLKCIGLGIDMFDCVMPTRAGRHGQAFTHMGRLNLRNARYGEDLQPIDRHSSWPDARNYSRAYLHHLIKAKESLGGMILTGVNLSYYQQLVGGARLAIRNGRYQDYANEAVRGWQSGDKGATSDILKRSS